MEIRRNVFHLIIGLLIVLLVYLDLLTPFLIGIIILIGLLVSLITRKYKLPGIDWFLKTFDREEDIKQIPGKGIIFMFVGAFIAVFFFPKDIALAAVIILALGDSVSRLVGPFGYLKHPFHSEKFLEGVIAGAFAATLGAMFFVPFVQAFFASVVAMLIEGVDLEIKKIRVDDNLMIPVVAGGIMWLIRSFWVF